MPTYEYVCSKCDQHIEAYQTFTEEPLKKHGGCGGKLTKVFGAVGIVLKGSGFYRTDNPSSARRTGEKSDSSGSSSSSETSGAGSSDSGTSTKTSESKSSDSSGSGSSDSGSSSSGGSSSGKGGDAAPKSAPAKPD